MCPTATCASSSIAARPAWRPRRRSTTENLFFLLQLKLPALRAEAKAIVVEEGQIVIRADSLEEVDRERLQRRLGERGRVSRRAVWIPLDEEDRWRTSLIAALQAISESLS